MRNLLLVVCFITASFWAGAQKVYFIYLQTDNTTPFYVKMNDKIYSSTMSGYLILSNLVDSTYKFSIGFPSTQKESKFTVALDSKDRGYLIKNFESGLGLFDLQNLTITNEQKDETPKNIAYQKRDDDFSYMLSKAANDTSLLYAVVRLKEEPPAQKEKPVTVDVQPKVDSSAGKSVETALKTDTSMATDSKSEAVYQAAKKDTAAVVELKPEEKVQDSAIVSQPKQGPQKQVDIVIMPPKEEPKADSATVAATTSKTIQTDSAAVKPPDSVSRNEGMETGMMNEQSFKRSKIKKHSESSTSEGFGLVYYDSYEGGEDTIRLLIPNPPITIKQQEPDSSESQKGFIQIDELKKDTEQKNPSVTGTSVKSDCKAIASDNDFLKLRKNMAAKNTDEAMVAEAKKMFKSRCFTTEQVKNLSALFLTSAGKYQFFDAAYFHVSDQENFAALKSEIKDDYYLKRFNALIGE